MNHMKEVAEILGVAIGERFKINGRVGEWYFTEKGLTKVDAPDEGASYYFRTLTNLLNGDYEIERLRKQHWRPAKGERY